MNATEQRLVRQRQSKLLLALRGAKHADAAAANAISPLPATTTWSHAGLYMGETGVQVSGHRLLVRPGAYVSGFHTVELDGVELPVSSAAVGLEDGSTILRSTSSAVRVDSAEASFELINSDHLINIHSATLHVTGGSVDHVDGLLGQTASSSFKVQRTASFEQHVENGFLLPSGADVWSTAFGTTATSSESGNDSVGAESSSAGHILDRFVPCHRVESTRHYLSVRLTHINHLVVVEYGCVEKCVCVARSARSIHSAPPP